MADRWGIDGEHGDRRFPPESGRETAVTEESETVDRSGLLSKLVLGEVEVIALTGDETRPW